MLGKIFNTGYKLMLRTVNLTVFSFILVSISFANNIDSLKKELALVKNDSEILDLLVKLNGLLIDTNPREAKTNLEKSLSLAKQLNNNKVLGEIYKNYGDYYNSLAEYDLAAQYFIKTISIAEKFKDAELLEKGLNNLAVIYARTNKYEDAQKLFLQLVEIAKERGNKSSQADYMINLAMLHGENGAMNKAEATLLHAIPLTEGNSFQKSVVLNTLSYLYNSTGRPQLALENANKALKLVSPANNLILYLEIMTNTANAYYGLKQFDKSVEINKNILKLAHENKLRLQEDNAFGNLYLNYEAKGDFKKALENFKKYSSLKDSLMNESIARQINELQVKYDTEKKEADFRKKETELHFQTILTNTYLAITVFSFIAIGLLIYLYVKRNAAYRSLVKINLAVLKEQKRSDAIIQQLKQSSSVVQESHPVIDEFIHLSSEPIKTSALSNEKKFELFRKITELKEAKIYLDKNISLDKMAAQIETNAKYLSQVIHEMFKTNFANFINELRINEARRMLCDSNYEQYSIEGIAEMAGFNSKQLFNKTFKKFTGITPSYYKIQSAKEVNEEAA
jgi:AraC-like DNA-binding protein/Flp pilus assembly protein TadD